MTSTDTAILEHRLADAEREVKELKRLLGETLEFPWEHAPDRLYRYIRTRYEVRADVRVALGLHEPRPNE